MTKEKKKNKKKKLPKLLESCIEDFSEQIKKRGTDYYERYNVLSCIKNKDDFIATVEGSDDNVYTVNIETEEGKVVYYDCTCPCDFPCKHVYATLLAIDNNEYESPKLKKKIPKKDYDLQEIVKNIPSKKLKQFLLEYTNSCCTYFSPNLFKKRFLEYFPKEKYEYYYNNLYNSFKVQNNINFFLDIYLASIKDYINIKDYKQAFLIIEAIIESIYDSENLDERDFITNLLLKLGFSLRNIYRNVDKKTKEEVIIPWITKVKNNNYYYNSYLEDLILSLN